MPYDSYPPNETPNLTAMDSGLISVLAEAYRKGFSVSSNFARTNAAEIGMAASMGLLTTRVISNVYSREWRPTILGLSLMNESELTND